MHAATHDPAPLPHPAAAGGYAARRALRPSKRERQQAREACAHVLESLQRGAASVAAPPPPWYPAVGAVWLRPVAVQQDATEPHRAHPFEAVLQATPLQGRGRQAPGPQLRLPPHLPNGGAPPTQHGLHASTPRGRLTTGTSSSGPTDLCGQSPPPRPGLRKRRKVTTGMVEYPRPPMAIPTPGCHV